MYRLAKYICVYTPYISNTYLLSRQNDRNWSLVGEMRAGEIRAGKMRLNSECEVFHYCFKEHTIV